MFSDKVKNFQKMMKEEIEEDKIDIQTIFLPSVSSIEEDPLAK